MATMTTIERLPGDWNVDNFGDGWEELGIDPAQVWVAMFDEWLETHYGVDIYRVGDSIYGPATIAGEPRRYQQDAPAEDLPRLPESIYSEFSGLHDDDWAEAIEEYAQAHGLSGQEA